jgi:uncharacterized protein
VSSSSPPTADHLRRYAFARTLFTPTTLPQAIKRLGFVQMDPIRAPARAQDLTLRHRVRGYRAGDLERRYPRLALEEDFFVNYGVLPREVQALMHPRSGTKPWTPARQRQAQAVLAFVRECGAAHPREVDERFQHGSTTNWFGGHSRASTQLLDGMHYRGLVRTARRDSGVRVYAERPARAAPLPVHEAMDRLVQVLLANYAPLPERTLHALVYRLRYGVPHWEAHTRPALARAKAHLAMAEVGGTRWYWPADENPRAARWQQRAEAEEVRLFAPFDPVVWDRLRFEQLWGWPYRFEAYTPAPKRLRGYYALPLAWRGQFVGWANLSVVEGRLVPDVGYVGAAPRGAAYRQALQAELQRMAEFLGLA